MITEFKACRACGGKLESQVNFGEHYVVDFISSLALKGNCLKAPLDLVKCDTCHLLQLRHSVDAKRLYEKFWYRSGINESMRLALKDVVGAAKTLVDIGADDSVLDIGCNDGTLLSMYPHSLRTVGIDPAGELVFESTLNGVTHGVTGFFSEKAVEKWAPYKVITAIAMFYDLDNPVQFLQDCSHVLHDDGVLIIQMNYINSMLSMCEVDNVCHEHVTYPSISSMKPMLEKAELEIVGATTNLVNGGSIRLYIMHKGHDVGGWRLTPNSKITLHVVALQLEKDERERGLDTSRPYQKFQEGCEQIKDVLTAYIEDQYNLGKKIYAYGASTRGTTLLQYLDVGRYLVAAAERDPNKFGLHMVGSWTPIKDEEECRKDADFFLLLPWHFKEGILKREHQWMADGGKFIVPLPTPHLIDSEGVRHLLPAEVRV